MKLKKIASLMLAGVMTVSMLAGCSTTAVDPEPTPNPDPVPESNYSTTFWNNLDEGKKNITCADDADLTAALTTAVGRAGTLTIAENYWGTDFVRPVDIYSRPASLSSVAAKLSELTGADNEELFITAPHDKGMESTLNQVQNGNYCQTDDDITAVALFVVDGNIAIDQALEDVAERLDEVIRDLQPTSQNGIYNKAYEYKYTGAVSVVSKSVDNLDGMSVNFIAVEIDRTTVQR